MNLKAAWSLLVDAGRDWSNDNATTYAAALAYYTVFSMAPLLLIAVAIAGAAGVFIQLQSALDSAASLIIILLWVYCSSLILFYGSEFTKIYSQRFGSRIIFAPHAEPRP